ncbi:NAD(P)H-hydrate dehydratase [Microvirga sp. SRT01]|uniref:Bifunctional NAD(P)H-hydrate repair enzyme n=1 Tax=Sphingomonas longa TaxID=2778730 RepID=A0ABS2D1T3_9SPHN|nr:NAD(P)H-hydrate dehydratase [Microvirga sp. SRT01]MBM6574860.1 NAD(P)H-hydrate dehydratase [Sphingomonas sp. BT552]MBR7707912.1 NAD(P)H-hydrate dehydratase [Microvirga sp. SRT01]
MIPLAGRPILTAVQMWVAEAAHGDLAGLMEQAGQGIATAVRRLATGAEVLILCGPGNNGGDGYVAARRLAESGHPVRVAASAPPATDLARAAADRWIGAVERLADAAPAPILVDSLFGTGLSRPLADDVAHHLHRLAASARLLIAVDLPSGVATDDGSVLTEPPAADLTLALGHAKPAHLLQPAARYSRNARIIDILAPSGKVKGEGSTTFVLSTPDLPEPGPDSHKFTRGMVAVVAGAMPGASDLASLAAMHAGAGYVLHLGDADGIPHALVRKTYSDAALDDPRIGAVVIGPGLGRDDTARARLAAALASRRPLVIDGDALHLFDPDASRHAPAILTPHAGEFKALFGHTHSSKIDRARAASARADAIVIYKGPDTVIAVPDGRAVVAGDASDWLSTAGTGDVLAGATGAMLASGLDPFAAACAAVWLHGEAARLCGRSFIADDLAAALSRVR